MKRVSAILLAVLTIACLAGNCLNRRYVHQNPPRKNLDIQTILDDAPDGSILTLDRGEYVFEQGLMLDGKSNLTITAPPGTRILCSDVMADVLSLEGCDSIRIENLTLSHLKPLKEYECDGACLRISDCRDIEVVNCELSGCGAFGIAGDDVARLRANGCYVHHNTFSAFYFNSCEDVLISGNRIVNNTEVVTEYSCDGINLQDNRLK
jgi:hypothetical protein